MNADTNITLIAMVRAEIDAALRLAQESLSRYLDAAAGENVIAQCVMQVHQVWGALRMVRLEGATRLSEEIETALRTAAGKNELELANRALAALRDFINDVAAGGANAPVQLFAVYRDLARANGKDTASEKDLFFPDLTLAAPAHPAARVLPAAERAAFLQTQRARYQRGLLAWLKQSDNATGLAQMREVLDGIDQISTTLPAPRALWWASVGMIDGLLYKPAAEWTARVKPVCSKIDFLLRDLAVNLNAATTQVQRDVLYAVATCRPVTARLRDVRKLFHLDSLIPHAALGDGDASVERLKPILEEARSRLENIKDTWAEYVSGEPKRLERFRELLPGLKEKAAELGNAQFLHLLDSIAAALPRLPDPYPLDGQLMSVEMASALLMAESILVQFHTLPGDLEQQIMIMTGWLVDAVQGKASTSSPPGLRADLVQQANDAKLRMATAREVIKNLARIEKTLEAFSRDLTLRSTLPPLKPALQQIHGVFEVLGYKRATSLLAICERMIERCADPAYHRASEDMEWIAEGLGSIGFYLEPCLHGRPPAERAINIFFNRYEQHMGAAAVTSPALGTAAPAATSARASGPPSPSAALDATMVIRTRAKPDNEMLEVFLEEANEVLAAIEDGIRANRKNPQDKDALMTVRRGFHTLKGGGRMVGLVTLGEAAWELEQVMNLWLEESRAATPVLLDLAADARAMFAQWVYELQDHIDPIIDPSRIAARARALRGGAPLPESSASDSATPAGSYMTLALPAAAFAAPAPQTPTEPEDFLTISIPVKAPASAAPPENEATPLAASGNFMTLKVPAATTPAPAASGEPEHQAMAFEQALTDLGDRLAWLGGLLDEMKIEAGAMTPTAARVVELTQMMAESMDEANALQRALAEQIAALKKND